VTSEAVAAGVVETTAGGYVLLQNHSIDADRWRDQPLTLVITNERRITGFITDDGTQLVRTGALA
jgi:hypothetical protein